MNKDFQSSLGKWFGLSIGLGFLVMVSFILYMAFIGESTLAAFIVGAFSTLFFVFVVARGVTWVQKSDNDQVITSQSRQISSMGRDMTRLAQDQQKMMQIPAMTNDVDTSDMFEVIEPDKIEY